MELIYISGLYMPASGGAEISMYTLIKTLSLKGFIFHVITKHIQNDDCRFDKKHKNIIVYRVNKKDEIEGVFKKINLTSPVKAVLTQNSWSEIAIKICQKYNCPSIYFLRAPFGELDISKTGEYNCDFIIANSIATRNYIIEKFKRHDALIIPPLINPNDYLVSSNSKEYITMVNPIQMKGGDIFKQIALALPDRKFLAVKGWSHLMHNDNWNLKLLEDLSSGMGIINDPVFDITRFDKVSNVTLQESTENMREIYSRTKLLIVPSITPEGGPRVALEAMMNGIPVIGSNSGNMALTIGSGGIIIKDTFNIDSWVEAICKFDNKVFYNDLSENAKSKTKINIEAELVEFENVLKIIHGKN
ncbi:glycosyltransferase [Mucilaginibacter ginsenosidivorax]|uniref:Glycosyltransferase n=1 Tax=Mucilaginibacter ginsenosidivorax TaxID=862126 RepID=A0A5B8W580_9SPHI|nr:glycosyltransferase [Mucilaginibacter ginsenosidivorax]QEC79034.1 glycosyltransferase [Mucilaginibacter ginsenosidivorax]